MNVYQLRPKSDAYSPSAPQTADHTKSDPIHSFEQQKEEADILTQKLNTLLEHYNSLLSLDDVDDRISQLREWSKAYHDGLTATASLAAKGSELVSNLTDQARLAVEEVHRLENEGGPPASPEQADQADKLLKATHKLDQVAEKLENYFSGDTTKSAQVETTPEH